VYHTIRNLCRRFTQKRWEWLFKIEFLISLQPFFQPRAEKCNGRTRRIRRQGNNERREKIFDTCKRRYVSRAVTEDVISCKEYGKEAKSMDEGSNILLAHKSTATFRKDQPLHIARRQNIPHFLTMPNFHADDIHGRSTNDDYQYCRGIITTIFSYTVPVTLSHQRRCVHGRK